MIIAEEDKDEIFIAKVYQIFAYISFQQKNYTEAIEISNISEGYYLPNNKFSQDLIDLYNTLQESYKAIGQYKSAYEVLTKSNNVKEQLLNEQIKKNQEFYEAKQKVINARIKIEPAKLQVKKANQGQSIKNWAILVILLLIILSVIATNKYINKQKLKHINDIKQIEIKLAHQKRRLNEIERDSVTKLKQEISEELHDNFLSSLSGIRLLSESLLTQITETQNKKLILRHQKEHTALKQLYVELRTYIDELRLGKMHTNTVYSNILADLTEFIKAFLEPSNIDVTIDSNLADTLGKLPDNIQMDLVKVVKEILVNMVKHSNAKNCFVKLNWDKTKFSISIYDDGVGFDKENLTRKSGLTSIEKRIKKSNGTFTLLSKAGDGTLIDIDFLLA